MTSWSAGLGLNGYDLRFIRVSIGHLHRFHKTLSEPPGVTNATHQRIKVFTIANVTTKIHDAALDNANRAPTLSR
jgi:hypothetical protein